MKVSTQILVCLAGLLAGTIPQAVKAQEADLKPPVPHTQLVSANPFLLLAEWVNVEYERKISPTGTIGVAGMRIAFDEGDESYKSLNGFYRYYPQGTPFRGFNIGGRLGFHQGSDYEEEGHAFGFGIDIGYSWLLGAKQNFYLGIGVGATRLFGGDLSDERVVLPSIRLLNVGFAF